MRKNKIMEIIGGLDLSEFQVEQITLAVLDMMDLNDEAASTKPVHCQKCNATHNQFIKKGVCSGKQRYQCKQCNCVFVWDVNKLTYRSQVKRDKWILVLIDTLNLVPLLKTASHVNLSEPTVFHMRHKFLRCFEELLKNESLEGVIECDDTFVLESCKGTVAQGRKARRRQEPASKRGLSNEQVCIMVATDRNGHEIATVIDREKPSEDAIIKGISNNIGDGCCLITDGLHSFNKLATIRAQKHYIVKNLKEYTNLIHINTVNSIHSLFKSMIRQYRGVATKYLNRYCALLVFIRRYLQMDDNKKLPLVLRDLNTHGIYTKHSTVSSVNLCLI